jgi:hypothetical protein
MYLHPEGMSTILLLMPAMGWLKADGQYMYALQFKKKGLLSGQEWCLLVTVDSVSHKVSLLNTTLEFIINSKQRKEVLAGGSPRGAILISKYQVNY